MTEGLRTLRTFCRALKSKLGRPGLSLPPAADILPAMSVRSKGNREGSGGRETGTALQPIPSLFRPSGEEKTPELPRAQLCFLSRSKLFTPDTNLLFLEFCRA